MSVSSPDTSPAALDTDQGTIPGPVKTVLAVLVTTAFVMMLNETTVAVALPAIMADYSISATTAQWLLTGFLLTMAVVLPATGWVLERFTTRSVFIFATVTFLAGTVAAAISPAFVVMLLARVAQAVGTAIIMPLLMTVTMTLVPPARRGTVMGLIAVVMAAGPALGPTVAGLVLSFVSWHGIFWVMVPLVAVATLIGAFKLTNIGERRAGPFDLLSMVLSVFAFGGLVYGLSSIGEILGGGADAGIAAAILGVGVVGLGLFVWRQIVRGRNGRALLDLRPLGVRNFTLSLVVLMALMAALLGVMNTLPLYLQGSLIVSALVTGLALLPGGLLEAVLSPIAGRLFDRVGPRPLIIPGMALVMGSLFWLSTIDERTSVWLVVAVHVVFSVGLAALFTPVMTTALGSLPANLYSHGSAIMNTMQQLAGAAGTATMIAIYSGVSADAMGAGVPETAALADGAGAAFFASAIVAVVALGFSLFVTRVPVDAPRTVVPAATQAE
ncbi:DHA2 family efflux MFS transporter permease subunit [Leucobacter luti]|uniref:DHA2 family lincomycin resistance protein-like MFS transporter n=1 Tax=Leucobacter luti TaxID=340320 RepID=A0A4Q7TX86_9MICO|nr:DHA2 family efflux MFS transporter permease subunit [Leucobacter luti]MBL3698176.1 DHA2 family efflux MFS transporter permease subunit [Leucobacter luti]RZT64740.1 DHA2 family lincomycin resistance protein-like MFS transporter [Leucobacter luti]